MKTYWVSYRIADVTVDGRSYENRYNAFVDGITEILQTWWSETTSYYAFTSPKGIGDVAARLKAAIKPSHDLFLLREMDARAARICGKNDDQNIFKLMPYLQLVP